MSYRANVVLGIFLLKRWVSIITLFCNLFYIRNTSRSYLTSERICIEYSRSSKFVLLREEHISMEFYKFTSYV